MKAKVEWGEVSPLMWLKQDVEIAQELGVSRERVRQVRPKGSVPQGYRRRTGGTAWQRIAAMDTKGKGMREVAEAAGCGVAHAGVAMRAMGKGYARMPKGNARYDWGLLPPGWRGLTDKELAGVVGASSPAVVAQWRLRHGMRKRG